jgi:hypothetical protein
VANFQKFLTEVRKEREEGGKEGGGGKWEKVCGKFPIISDGGKAGEGGGKEGAGKRDGGTRPTR